MMMMMMQHREYEAWRRAFAIHHQASRHDHDMGTNDGVWERKQERPQDFG